MKNYRLPKSLWLILFAVLATSIANAQTLSITGFTQNQTFSVNQITTSVVEVGQASDRVFLQEFTFTVSSATGTGSFNLSDFNFLYQGTDINDIESFKLFTRASPSGYLTPALPTTLPGNITIPGLGTNAIIDFKATTGTYGAIGNVSGNNIAFSFPINILSAGTYTFQLYAKLAASSSINNIIDVSLTGFNYNAAPYTGNITNTNMSSSLVIKPRLSGSFVVDPNAITNIFSGYQAGVTLLGTVFTSSGQAFDAINRYEIADGGLSLLYKDDAVINDISGDYSSITAEKFPNSLLWKTGRSNAPFLISRTGDGANQPTLRRTQFAHFVLDAPQYLTVSGLNLENTAANSGFRHGFWIISRGDRSANHVVIKNNTMNILTPANNNNNSYIFINTIRTPSNTGLLDVIAENIIIEENLMLNGVSGYRVGENLASNTQFAQATNIIVANNTATGFTRRFINNLGFSGLTLNITVTGNIIENSNKLTNDGVVEAIGGNGTAMLLLRNVSGNVEVNNNIVRNITFNGINTSSTAVRGIMVSANRAYPTTVNIFNNIVANVNFPNVTVSGSSAISYRAFEIGVDFASGTFTPNYNIYHNTSYIKYNSTQLAHGATSFQMDISNASNTAIFNNIWYTDATYTGGGTPTGIYTAISRNNTMSNRYSSLSGHNLVYSPDSPYNFLNARSDNTTERDKTIEEYRSRFTATGINFDRERFSFTESVTPFTSINNPRLAPAEGTTSKVFGGGKDILPGLPYETDIEGNPRPATMPTIGAYQFVDLFNQNISGLASGYTFSVADVSTVLSAVASSGLAVSYASSTPSIIATDGSVLSFVGYGVTTITAMQAGNVLYNSATPVSSIVTVTGLTQSISFEPIGNKPADSGPFALSATVSSGLTAAYSIVSGPASVSGNTLTLTSPSKNDVVTVRANQSGNNIYLPAISVDQSFTVVGLSQDITGLNEFGTVIFGNAPISLASVTGGMSGNPVVITSSNPSVASVSGNNLVINSAGTTTITASQIGNSVYESATEVVRVLTVNKATQSISGFNPTATFVYGDADVSLPTQSSISLAIDYSSSNSNVISIVGGNMLKVIGVGVATIVGSNSGNSNYEALNTTQIVTVNKKALTLAIGSVQITYKDALPTFTGTLSGVANNDQLNVVYSASVTSLSGAGSYAITASVSGTAFTNYVLSIIPGTITIAKASQTIEAQIIDAVTLTGNNPLSIPLNITVSSGLAATVELTEGEAVITDSSIVVSTPGVIKLSIKQSGDNNYLAAAPVELTINVVKIDSIPNANASFEKSVFRAYPNPATELVNIESTDDAYLYTVEGLLLQTLPSASSNHVLRGLKPGLYILKSGSKTIKLTVQ